MFVELPASLQSTGGVRDTFQNTLLSCVSGRPDVLQIVRILTKTAAKKMSKSIVLTEVTKQLLFDLAFFTP
jgi:hypothetical protein